MLIGYPNITIRNKIDGCVYSAGNHLVIVYHGKDIADNRVLSGITGLDLSRFLTREFVYSTSLRWNYKYISKLLI